MAEEKLIGIDLSIASEEVIRIILDDPSDEGTLREVLEANRQRPGILRLLYEHPGTPGDIVAEAAALLSLPARTAPVEPPDVERAAPKSAEGDGAREKTKTLLQRIQRLSVGQKIQIAMKGGKEIRNVLIRDPNKEVVLKVLDNPKITENEVELIARNPSSPEDALRFISKKKDWIRRYNVMFSLVSNPKTPPGVSLQFIARLRLQDLVILEKNKNIPEAVRNAVKRYLKLRKK